MYAELERPGVWRVDAIGNLHLSTIEGSRVEVYFSEIHEWAKANPFQVKAGTGNSLSLSVTNAALLHFIPGSLWSGGERVGFLAETLGTYLIDSKQCQQIQLSDSFRFRGNVIDELLPESHIRLSSRDALAETWLHVAPVQADDRTLLLIIPSAEVFRFYYGVSTRLIRHILSGDVSSVVDWEASTASEELARIVANIKLYNEEAIVLARAKFWEHVHNPLFIPWKACVMSSMEKSRAALKAAFPFIGSTRLQVAGKRIPLRDEHGNPVWAVYVSEIIQCHRELEFERISVALRKPTAIRDAQSQHSEQTSYQPWLHSDPLDESWEAPVVDDPADANLSRTWFRRENNRFPGATATRISTVLEEEQVDAASPKRAQESHVSGQTLQSGNYSKATRLRLGLDWIDYSPERIASVLERFLSVMRHVQKIKAHTWSVQSRHAFSAANTSLDQVTTFPTLKRSRYSWHLILAENGTIRLRQVAWIEIIQRSTNQFVYALEMEFSASEGGQCTLILRRRDYRRMSDKDMLQFLRLTVIKHRWPFATSRWKKKSHKQTAERLFREFQFIRLVHRTPIKGQYELPDEVIYIEARGKQVIDSVSSALSGYEE